MTCPRTVISPGSEGATQLVPADGPGVEREPMPQSNANVNPADASTGEASVAFVRLRWKVEPYGADGGALKVAVGATFDARATNWSVALEPFWSVALTVIVVGARPSGGR